MLKKALLKQPSYLVFFSYLLILGVLLSPAIQGIGNYWDWGFTYFSDYVPNIFLNAGKSWIDASYGSPLNYSSDYYFRLLVYILSFLNLNPEILLYLILLFSLTLTSFGVYLILRNRKLNPSYSFLMGLAASINSAILYKFFAGHIGYIVSIPIFVFIVYFLMCKYSKNAYSSLVLGLLLGFSGVQIQFFIISAVFLLVYFLFHREKFSLRYIIITLALALLINLPWLSNFLVGAASITEFGQKANTNKFSELFRSDYVSIFKQSFSKATLLEHLYGVKYFAILFLLPVGLFLAAIFGRKNKDFAFLLSLNIIFIFLLTGKFHFFAFPIISRLYPMVREISHFAPPLVLFEILAAGILLLSRMKSFWVGMLSHALLIVFLLVNTLAFYQYLKLPKPNFNEVRKEFADYKKFYDGHPTDRIMTYPFFGQYSFNKVEKVFSYRSGFPYLVNNSGWDNFTNYSNIETINNSLSYDEFEDSVQNRFSVTKNLNLLKEKGVRYIADYSQIYESNYERYIPKTAYGNDLSRIKNDSNFFKVLLEQNPESLKKVESAEIYEILDSPKKVFLTNNTDSQVYFKKVSPAQYEIKIDGVSPQSRLVLLNNFHKGWSVYVSDKDNFGNCSLIHQNECEADQKYLNKKEISLFSKKNIELSHTKYNGWANQWDMKELSQQQNQTMYLTVYFQPQSFFLIAQLISLASIFLAGGIITFLLIRSRKKIV